MEWFIGQARIVFEGVNLLTLELVYTYICTMKNTFNTLIFGIVCSFCLSMCNAQPATTEKAEQAATTKKKPTGPLAEKLYANYIDNPKTQAEIDQNRIIDYAFAKNLYIVKSESGLFYSIVKAEEGENLVANQRISAQYVGNTLDGKQFDSSYDRGAITFNVGTMIPGWNEALLLMNKGSKANLVIPSHLAYGVGGYTDKSSGEQLIGPNEPLHFVMEVLQD